MITLDQLVIEAAAGWCEKGLDVWLCTVLKTYGSSPRVPGTMMAVNSKGEYRGSLSGGCIEDDFLYQLSQGAYRKRSQTVRYGEGGLRPDVKLPCGGSIEIIIEFLSADRYSTELLSAMRAALSGEKPLIKIIKPEERAYWKELSRNEALPVLSYTAEKIILPVGPVPVLFVAGFSTVAYECIRMGLMLGFSITVCEHRPEQLLQVQEAFAGNANVNIVPQHPSLWLESRDVSSSTAILSLTHDPRIDELTLMEAVHTSAFYIGVMGSAKNSEKRRQRLLTIGGLTEEELGRIHAPIGIRIGSKTPAEIALSVMADIVREKNTR